MKKFVRYGLIGLVVVLLLLAAAPWLIPSGQFRQMVESEVAQATGAPVKIGALSVRLFPLPSLAIKNLSIEDVKGGVPKLVVASGSLTVELAPLLEGRIDVSAITFKNVILRVSKQARGKRVHSMHMDTITGAIKLTDEALILPNWKAKLYGGTVTLHARLSPLQGKKRALAMDIKVTDIQMLPLMNDAAGQDKVSGTFSAALNISATGVDEKAMQQSLQVDGPVSLAKGQFKGVGLSGVAAALVHGNVTGMGSTIVFDTFKTRLQVRGRDMQLNHIVLASSSFDATGHVSIKAAGELDGQIITSGMGGISGAKLLVGGTTDTPRIYPAPSSLIGGTIGATLGGPAGAAVGSKVGGVAGDAVESIGSGMKRLFSK